MTDHRKRNARLLQTLKRMRFEREVTQRALKGISRDGEVTAQTEVRALTLAINTLEWLENRP